MAIQTSSEPPGAAQMLFSGFSPVFQGVSHGVGVCGVSTWDGTTPRIQRVNAFRIDLTAPGIDFRTTPLAGKDDPKTNGYTSGDTIIDFMQSNPDVMAAINANYTYGKGGDSKAGLPYGVLGYVVSRGEMVSDPTIPGWNPGQPATGKADVVDDADAGSQALIIRRHGQAFKGSVEAVTELTGLPADVYVAVAGSPQPQSGQPYAPKARVSGPLRLVSDGVNRAYATKDANKYVAGRTGIGVDKDGTTLYLVVLDGCENVTPSYGGDFCDIAQWLIAVGAYEAINVDGGGSSVAAMRTTVLETIDGKSSHVPKGPSMLSIPYGDESNGPAGCRRSVGVYLGVSAREL